MSKKELDHFVKQHANAIINAKIQELRVKYPEGIKKDFLRFRYGWGEGEQTIYDKQIEI